MGVRPSCLSKAAARRSTLPPVFPGGGQLSRNPRNITVNRLQPQALSSDLVLSPSDRASQQPCGCEYGCQYGGAGEDGPPRHLGATPNGLADGVGAYAEANEGGRNRRCRGNAGRDSHDNGGQQKDAEETPRHRSVPTGWGAKGSGEARGLITSPSADTGEHRLETGPHHAATFRRRGSISSFVRPVRKPN